MRKLHLLVELVVQTLEETMDKDRNIFFTFPQRRHIDIYNIEAVEQELIRRVLDQTNWNRKKAAEILGISYKALLYKIKQFQNRVAVTENTA